MSPNRKFESKARWAFVVPINDADRREATCRWTDWGDEEQGSRSSVERPKELPSSY